MNSTFSVFQGGDICPLVLACGHPCPNTLAGGRGWLPIFPINFGMTCSSFYEKRSVAIEYAKNAFVAVLGPDLPKLP